MSATGEPSGIVQTLQSTPPPDQFLVSEQEAVFHYAGLPSSPRLVARSSPTPWRAPTGVEAYRQLKELRPVGNHALNDIWEENLASDVLVLLESKQVKWTSIDVVRIVNAGETSQSSPAILWIGVTPASVSRAAGLDVALKCKGLLVQNGITDVDVELRESVVTRSVGPRLLEPKAPSLSFSFDPTVDARVPLTATLDLPICAELTPEAEGTGGFYIAEGGGSKRIFLVTARHVVFPLDSNNNNVEYYHNTTSQPHHNVLLLGDAAFSKLLESTQLEIRGRGYVVEYQESRTKAADGKEGEEWDEERNEAQAALKKSKDAIEDLNLFYSDLVTRWSPSENRVLGHVVFSPPISVDVTADRYLEDFAIIEVDSSKINASNFKGNVIDLGTRISLVDFVRTMRPNPTDPSTFEYPLNRLLQLKDAIPDAEMRRPTILDQNSDPCLMVIKRGNTTGLTIGRANNVFSYVRNYFDDNSFETSKEWAILSLDTKSGAFSAKGDSGSVIVDGLGRIGGLITGGAGDTSDFDITYATPLGFIMRRIRQKFSQAHLNPVLIA